MSETGRAFRRITGLETEYGCLVGDARVRAIPQVRDWVFARERYGLLDRHHRGWDEPPGNGGFLFNGGRLYVDMGHLEYCTPECMTLADVVRYDRAGDRMLLEALKAQGLDARAGIFRNNIDHHTGATFGCHENYSLSRTAPLSDTNLLSLLSFLTLRVLFAGTGRVGAHSLTGQEDTDVTFQISQRADFIEKEFYEWVQHNRAIINTRDEPLADPREYRRLHLLHGDTNVLPSALYLKIGSTRLMLDLLEADALPKIAISEPVLTMRALSRRLQPPWRVRFLGGGWVDAVELLAKFRGRAEARFGGRDAETDAVLRLWARAERALAEDPMSLVGVVDWVTKLHLLETFRAQEKLEWDDPWLEAQDLEYHHIDPDRSLGLPLADRSGPWAQAADDAAAVLAPPPNTRAALRSALMRQVSASGERYEIDWHRVESEKSTAVLMLDPFQSEAEPA